MDEVRKTLIEIIEKLNKRNTELLQKAGNEKDNFKIVQEVQVNAEIISFIANRVPGQKDLYNHSFGSKSLLSKSGE